MSIGKRDFLFGAGFALAAGAARAQTPPAGAPSSGGGERSAQVPHRTATTRTLFKAPPGFPNAIAVTPEGLWIGEQKMSGAFARQYHMPEPTDLREAAWLVDWNGKLLKTIMTASRNTSGMAVGGGYLWMGAEFAPPHDGIYQYRLSDGSLVAQRQVPLGTAEDGGGIHGALWQDGKLWVLSNRLHAIMRIDPSTWTAEFLIPLSNEVQRYHAIAWDNGAIWAVTGNNSTGVKNFKGGLDKYDATSGKLLEIVDLAPGSSDPHGLAMHEGKLISCDAGIHPGWPNFDSSTSGYIFQIDLA
ncbi:MAG TPA: hypothetical protein VHV26_00090 [Rhizomicrobium sp.]|nr:hypothetical protein [Rhizomicrobium sp.]